MPTSNTKYVAAETLDQVKNPEGLMDMDIEDVIPKVWLAFMWRKNQARLEQARQLNPDLQTMSISKKTSLVLFHSLTDKEMEPQHSGNGGGFKARDLAMWKRSMDNEKGHEKNYQLGLGSIARDIVEDGRGIRQYQLTDRVTEAYRVFIRASYPLDVVLSILKPRVSSARWFGGNDMGNWLKESAQTGLITIGKVRESLGICCPFEPGSEDLIDWHEATIQPIISSLERFTKSGATTPVAYGRLETIRNDCIPSEPLAIIQEYLGTLPEVEQVDYWARLLDYIQAEIGEYEEIKRLYLVYPEKLGERSKRGEPVLKDCQIKISQG